MRLKAFFLIIVIIAAIFIAGCSSPSGEERTKTNPNTQEVKVQVTPELQTPSPTLTNADDAVFIIKLQEINKLLFDEDLKAHEYNFAFSTGHSITPLVNNYKNLVKIAEKGKRDISTLKISEFMKPHYNDYMKKLSDIISSGTIETSLTKDEYFDNFDVHDHHARIVQYAIDDVSELEALLLNNQINISRKEITNIEIKKAMQKYTQPK